MEYTHQIEIKLTSIEEIEELKRILEFMYAEYHNNYKIKWETYEFTVKMLKIIDPSGNYTA